jgi:hypothetical protein
MLPKQAATLLDYAGKRVTVICEECEILRHFEGDKLVAEYGDEAMPHLLADLAKGLGCDRPKVGYHNLCRLSYHRPFNTMVEELGYISKDQHEVSLGKRLSDLLAWEVLHAVCSCGRRAKLNRKALERQVGKNARIKDLAPKLHCKECKRYATLIEISTLPR